MLQNLIKSTILTCVLSLGFGLSQAQPNSIINGGTHLDTAGNEINAHGAGYLKVGDYFYWIGENRKDGILISCYRSKDLVNWEFRGNLLTRQSHPDLANANVERPKVIYNDKTKQFVMWMHWEISTDYSYARAAVAYSDDIEKPFTYIKSFRPFDFMSRDCTLFKDDDGKAYFLSATRENLDMNIYELTDDYLDVKKHLITLWPGGHREAPALVKRNGYYVMVTSYCTGWDPNQAKYAFSKSITGPWSELKDVGCPMSFDTQPTYIIPVQGTKTTSYIYVGDRWDPSDYFNSKYIFLPLTFKNDTTISLEWVNQITPNIKTGELKTETSPIKQYRLKSKWTGNYLESHRSRDGVLTRSIRNSKLGYKKVDQRWEVIKVDHETIKIKHAETGHYLEIINDEVKLSTESKNAGQQWKVVTQPDGWCKLVNKATGKALTIDRSQNRSVELLKAVAYDEKYDPWWDRQGFLLAPIYE